MRKDFCSVCPSNGQKQKIHHNSATFVCSLKSSETICNLLEVRLLELIQDDNPNKTFDLTYLQKLADINSKNGIELQRKITHFKYKKPKTLAGFLYVIMRLHYNLFKDLPLKDVGERRKDRVWFDINSHTHEGAHPDHVLELLLKLWKYTLKPFLTKKSLSREEIIFLSANFLSQFFRIHPFRDGNGRVARSFIKLVMYHYGYEIYFNPVNGKSQGRYTRRYIKALRYSHKRFFQKYKHDSFVGHPDLRYMNRLLISFLDELVTVRIPDSQVEVEPGSIGTKINRKSFLKRLFSTLFK